jgi:itaconyl-CoA hydratase
MDGLLPAYKAVGERRYRETSGLYWEDFEPGDIFEHRPGRTVLDVDNTYFTLLTLNVQQVHFDAAYAAKTEWKKMLVDSTFTLALLTGMSVRTVSAKVVANLGWDKVKATHPVFAGDTLYAESTVLNKRESKSRPNAGHRHRVHPWFEPGRQGGNDFRADHARASPQPLARGSGGLLSAAVEQQ